MASSLSASRRISLWACSALALLGCSAEGATGRPQLFVLPPEPDAVAPVAAPAPDVAILAPGPAAPPTSAASADPAACATASVAVELARQPVDIIIALDNSASMDDEARAVEANLDVNFADILQQSGVDYRVILVSEHRQRNLQDTAVCILSPLSTLSACPSAEPGTSERFFQYSIEVGSRDSFQVLLESFDGREPDDFGLAPRGWAERLRPQAKQVFLEITDDDENSSAQEFLTALTALAPQFFGTDPSQPDMVWHSIVGLVARQVATEPYLATDPIETRECDGDVFNAGATYQELSRLTGGLRFPICEFDGYDAVFRAIAQDVVLGSRDACELPVPEPPQGRALDLDAVAVSYRPGSGGPARVLGQVRDVAACGADAFLVDGAGVHLCPDACDVVSADPDAAVEVLFTCQSTVLR